MRKRTKEWKKILVLAVTTAMLASEMSIGTLAASVEETAAENSSIEIPELSEETDTASDNTKTVIETEVSEKSKETETTEKSKEAETSEESKSSEILEASETLTESLADESESITTETCTETVFSSELTDEQTETVEEESRTDTLEEVLETEETACELTTSEEVQKSALDTDTKTETDFVLQDGKLTQYHGTEADVVIPEGVVIIGADVFKGNASIKTVTFPATVTTIERGAFQDSSLQSVILNEGLQKIDNNAFRKTPLGKLLDTGRVELGVVTIPSTVQYIGTSAFEGCAYLGEVVFQNGENKTLDIQSSILYKVFGDCKNLTRVVFPDRLKSIPDYAFSGCTNLKETVFGNGLEKICNAAFEACSSLQTIELPASVVEISWYAFQNCVSLEAAALNEGLRSIGGKAFYNTAFGTCLDTGEIKAGKLLIPSTVQTIGGGAFQNCKYLGEIEFKNEGTEILTIESSILNQVFGGCKLLEKITFPERLKTIPDYAFSGCTGLREVVFGSFTEELGQGVFENCTALEAANLPAAVVTIKSGAFQGCSRLKSADLKEGLRTIEIRAFYGAAFEDGYLNIPSTVQRIGKGAFASCSALTEVSFANGDTVVLQLESSITDKVFGDCTKLEKVKLPDRLKVIPEYAFSGCTALREVVFGNAVEEIGQGAFQNCSKLQSVTMPFTMRTIGDNAFYGCAGLTSVVLNEGLKIIGNNAFHSVGFGEQTAGTGAVRTGTLTIPSSVQQIGRAAFNECAYLGKVIFANGETVVLTIAGSYEAVFGQCLALTTVVLPERLTKLEMYTFYQNTKLEALYIPQGVKEIADSAVTNCPNCIIYGVPGSAAETYAKNNQLPFRNKDGMDLEQSVQSVRLSPARIVESGKEAIGKQHQLYAEVLPDTAQNKAVSYQSDNENVASVNAQGLVTIMGYGNAAVTVTTADGAKTAQCTVVVTEEETPVEEKPLINSVLFPKKMTEYSAVYTGEQIRPAMIVSYQYTNELGSVKTQKLKLNADYTVRYSGNVQAGERTAKVTVRGIGEYAGVITKEFTIQPKSISGVTLSAVGDIVYGEEPVVTVMDGTYELKKDKDYEIVLSTVGGADRDTPSVLTVKGIGNYTGVSRKRAQFNILRAETDIRPIAAGTVRVAFKKLPVKGYTYNGKAQKPAVVVTDTATGRKLSSKEYKVLYTNNVHAGTAKAWVVGVSKNGKGYYGIATPLSFEIKQKDFGKVSASLSGTIPKAGSIDDMKNAVGEAITVKDAKHILSDEEYTIDYSTLTSADRIQTGKKYAVTLTPKQDGDYLAESKKTVYIKFGQLSLASKTAKISIRILDPSQNEIELYYNGILLIKGRDYTAAVKKENRKETYTVKIKAVPGSAYKGSRTMKKVSF